MSEERVVDERVPYSIAGAFVERGFPGGHHAMIAAELALQWLADAGYVVIAKEEREAADALAMEYTEHQSWRCGHPDRYPHDPDCPCGYVAALARYRRARGRP